MTPVLHQPRYLVITHKIGWGGRRPVLDKIDNSNKTNADLPLNCANLANAGQKMIKKWWLVAWDMW